MEEHLSRRSLVKQELALIWKEFLRGWYKFSRNPLSVIGLVFLGMIVLAALLAPYITPYPKHAGPYTNFAESSLSPSLTHPFGTDTIGRDTFTRVIFGYRFSLILALVVLSLSVPPGVLLGLIAGYYEDTWMERIIMRLTDIFLAVPPLILALAIVAILGPNFLNEMMAISLAWWPWYCRLIYSITRSLRPKEFVQEAELLGASVRYILFHEILPNCSGPLLTKMTLDMGFAILVGAALSFIGLGVQPPDPGLGTMVAYGVKQLPANWWMALFPSLAIIVVVLAFNLVGDGLRDVFGVEEV